MPLAAAFVDQSGLSSRSRFLIVSDWPAGPRQLVRPRLVDGVVAYWAHCYSIRWPDTEWRVHEGHKSDVDIRQPVLWIDGGRGQVNLRRIVRNSIAGVVIRGEPEPGRFRRVWEIHAPKD